MEDLNIASNITSDMNRNLSLRSRKAIEHLLAVMEMARERTSAKILLNDDFTFGGVSKTVEFLVRRNLLTIEQLGGLILYRTTAKGLEFLDDFKNTELIANGDRINATPVEPAIKYQKNGAESH